MTILAFISTIWLLVALFYTKSNTQTQQEQKEQTQQKNPQSKSQSISLETEKTTNSQDSEHSETQENQILFSNEDTNSFSETFSNFNWVQKFSLLTCLFILITANILSASKKFQMNENCNLFIYYDLFIFFFQFMKTLQWLQLVV